MSLVHDSLIISRANSSCYKGYFLPSTGCPVSVIPSVLTSIGTSSALDSSLIALSDTRLTPRTVWLSSCDPPSFFKWLRRLLSGCSVDAAVLHMDLNLNTLSQSGSEMFQSPANLPAN